MKPWEVEYDQYGRPINSASDGLLSLEETIARKRGTLPIKNQYGQYQVGGGLGGELGMLDFAYQNLNPVLAWERFTDASQPVVTDNLMGGADVGIKDKYAAALEASALMGLGLDWGDIGRAGYQFGRPAVGKIAGMVDDIAAAAPKSPMSAQSVPGFVPMGAPAERVGPMTELEMLEEAYRNIDRMFDRRAVPRGNSPNTIGKGERGAIGVKGDKPLIYTNEDLSVTPDVPQFGLDRYEAPRGKPAALKGLLGKRTANRMSEYAKAGEEGGKGWYNLDPLREQFVAELGEVEGNAQFRRYTDHLAATSPREKVKQNVKRGSLFHQMERSGEPFAHLKNPGKGDGPGTEIPKGYGSLGHETQRYLLSDLEGGGHFSSMGRPKTSSFAENLSGNQTPITIDTHNMAALMNNKGTKRSPTPGEYKYIEDFEADIADQLGMTPAQFQASVWVGAGNDTGVADVRPFLDVFNDVVVETAEKRGITPAEALTQFIKGEKPLLGLVGMLSAGTLMEPDQPVE